MEAESFFRIQLNLTWLIPWAGLRERLLWRESRRSDRERFVARNSSMAWRLPRIWKIKLETSKS